MQLFYTPDITQATTNFTFDKTESKHIIKVLRKNTGDLLFITNGNGELFTSEIIIGNEKSCTVKINQVKTKKKPWNYYLHVAIAPTKNINRFEWFLEKATEIGIDEITPILCDRSERKVIKMDRLSRILESAMKQSLKFQLPKLNNLTSFSDFIEQSKIENLFIAHCENTDKKTLKENLKPQQNATILIGPEGDFSTAEIKNAINNNFKPISLGESRLRTETAGIMATQLVSFINQ
ncbi:16S rRNA (uracil(1498)-N(3))-methyltransferase [Aureibaculum sp. 2210JD6-5]|uniref:16S rRNA (uracil(1498)-N(3))-methyltransferase n=1 Tax=Aureibaculum sp. 2210JD6-5 TaxID=3103957 RepID=UPI002AAE4B76|nr:16S rRNA (uracil(1498)-N(3))-methyltransferase [Aureibaculum sp. 2210JD6-5]MDY7396601.1 16S rRNA (uracil(1498)-N(3))-methyltransferase [Aureibaculum sp. 2210JD6-5]